MPSATRRLRFCQRLTAALVRGPKTPSAVAPTLRCTALTTLPREPTLTRPVKAFAFVTVGAVTAGAVTGAAEAVAAAGMVIPAATTPAAAVVVTRVSVVELFGARWRPT